MKIKKIKYLLIRFEYVYSLLLRNYLSLLIWIKKEILRNIVDSLEIINVYKIYTDQLYTLSIFNTRKY